MYDAGKVIAGIVIFLALITFPIWFNAVAGEEADAPDLAIDPQYTQCVESTEYMKRNHMDLLNEWRDIVVREGQRTFIAPDGNEYEMSLTNTCMKCHSNRAEFCQKCHNYMAVAPYCWDCHLEPEEVNRGN